MKILDKKDKELVFPLNEVSQKYCGTGKAVNTGDEDFIFTKCHRVAILCRGGSRISS